MRQKRWGSQAHLQPRQVNRDTRDRAQRIIDAQSGLLKPEQRPLLEKIIDAHTRLVAVHKHELDRALGIIGSIERDLP